MLIQHNMNSTDFIKTTDDAQSIYCYDCSDEINSKHNIYCNGTSDWCCYLCWQCFGIQHINKENKMTEGHHVNCNEYYNCHECNEPTVEKDTQNYIDFPDDGFIFDKDTNTNVKYNDKYYHYECLCKSLVCNTCNTCKKYCKDMNDMRDINNDPKATKQIYVCIECYDNADIYKCYNNYHDSDGCKGERVLMKCYFHSQCKKYSQGCIKCNKSDWIKEYCDWCR